MATFSSPGVVTNNPLSDLVTTRTLSIFADSIVSEPHTTYSSLIFRSGLSNAPKPLIEPYTTRYPTSNALRVDFLLGLYLNFNRYIVGNKYLPATNQIKTTANDKGLYHVMMIERTDGTSYYATQKVDNTKYSAYFTVPDNTKSIITMASSRILFSSFNATTGTLTDEFVPQTSASGARAKIVSSSLEAKPGGFLATVVTDRDSYVYAFVREQSTNEIVKVIRSKKNTITHHIYIKIAPGNYNIEYTAFVAPKT